MENTEVKTVLSVEDEDAAYVLLEIAFEEIGQKFRLERVCDGEQAISFLGRTGRYVNAPRPDLVLLNLNMPRMTGIELLERLRKETPIEGIPLIVFSSSRLDADRARCIALGATSYIVKPTDYDDFISAVKSACASA